jgi:hypothetical protein
MFHNFEIMLVLTYILIKQGLCHPTEETFQQETEGQVKLLTKRVLERAWMWE